MYEKRFQIDRVSDRDTDTDMVKVQWTCFIPHLTTPNILFLVSINVDQTLDLLRQQLANAFNSCHYYKRWAGTANWRTNKNGPKDYQFYAQNWKKMCRLMVNHTADDPDINPTIPSV